MSGFLAPVAILGVLALTGCGGGTQTDEKAAAPSSAAASTSPTAVASRTATRDPAMPALHSQTYRQGQEKLARQDISAARVTAAALHKDVTLPQDHDDWRICDTSPQPGAPLPVTAAITLELAEEFSDCTTSFHGYLHQKNDPAYTPPRTATPQPKSTYAPKPAKTRTPTRTPAPARTTAKPAGSSMTTCPDGKQGYACTSNGHPVVDGQFCAKADRGLTRRATNGTTVTCSYDPSITPYRWQ